MRRWLAACAASLSTLPVLAANPAADKPLIGPPPTWVKLAEVPADTAPPDQNAVRVLLSDQQSRLLPNGGQYYSETMVRIQTPQGLTALGTLTFPWKPDTSTLTVHRLRIIRDGKVIDLLGKGDGFTVLRREDRLEYATLDGVLTAVIQPEGLQVGDILDQAVTVTSADPVLGGNSEQFVAAGPQARAAHYRVHIEWDDKLPIRWRAGDGLPKLTEHRAGGMAMLDLAMDNLEPVIPPDQAPPRFLLTRYLQLTSLRDWNQLSALFAPLYTKAAALQSDSPLQVEIARIAAASPDPVKRAEAALALVQDKVRYVFLGLADGGLVPADANLTWQRRFGDCKGKTVLLLALLHGLGIRADPAIVSSQLGDGLNERLPMVGLFDHVLVRADIGDKTYWLDGTRIGDVRLADIQVPDFRFALPLRMPGATLEPLVVPVPAKPLSEYALRVDMRAGASQPFPFHVEEISRGDEALSMHLRLENMTAEMRQQSLRDYFAGAYSDVEPKTYSATWDPAIGEEKLVMDGLEKHDWRWSYEADHAGVGWKADFDRPAGPHRDAPFSIGYPYHTLTRETILLPNGGKGFVNQTKDVDQTVAGIEYHRVAKLDGATFTIETRARSVAREFPAAQAGAAQTTLRELAKEQPLLGVTGDYRSTKAEEKAVLATNPQSAGEYVRRGQARAAAKDRAGALADADEAVRRDPKSAAAFWLRADLHEQQGQADAALADMRQVTTLLPDDADAQSALAHMLTEQADFDEAITVYDRALARTPKSAALLSGRAATHYDMAHYDQALADAAAAIHEDATLATAYVTRINAFYGKAMPDAAIAEGKAGVAANPDNDYFHILLASVYARLGRLQDATAEIDRAIRMKPSALAYLEHANERPHANLADRHADVAAALKLEPDNDEAADMMVWINLQAHDYAGDVAAANDALAKRPDNPNLLVWRGIGLSHLGRRQEADRDFALARKKADGDPAALNNLCWEKAEYDTDLPSALDECEAALKLAPKAANIIDSRGFALLRLGRLQDAISTYDRALKLRPNNAESFYGRGIAKLRSHDTASGKADIQTAKTIDPGVEREFADYGITP